MATSISNGESGLSVRTKLNDIWHSLDLNEYNKEILVTATDVFVYDTSRDTDGGSWRKRTQGTSWYNETLNTATRGSRKEFPAVAVIVSDLNRVTIYDGDDPSLPMWMVINEDAASKDMLGRRDVWAVEMLNGLLCVVSNDAASPGGYAPLVKINFINDVVKHINAIGTYTFQETISEREAAVYSSVSINDSAYWLSSEGDLVGATINDVAMTVLPNAPIDAATGLSVPTIAVATNSGLSVIRDDGAVYDITDSSGNGAWLVDFTDDNRIMFQHGQGITGINARIVDIPTSDVSSFGGAYYAGNQSGALKTPLLSLHGITANGENKGLGYSSTGGLVQLFENTTTPSKGMLARSTSSYNTGWMNGDIKLATLSDTDDTDVTGSELVTNTALSDWLNTDATTWSSGALTLTGNTYTSNSFTTVSGKTYTWSVEITAAGGTSADLRVGSSENGQDIYDTPTNVGVGKYSVTFTATSSTTYITLKTHYPIGSPFTITFDNISVRLAEEDRSVNGNGLQVFGTVTKSAVATGADLVAYGPFSSSNGIVQPYNSGLDFGTDDFSISVWHKGTGVNDYILARRTPASNAMYVFIHSSGTVQFFHGSATETGSTSIVTGEWTHICCLRRNGRAYVYVNGVEDTNGASSGSVTLADAKLGVGLRPDSLGTALSSGSLALLRISATAPSPEQIKKIYEDEKVLFQENAQATLYGSSDAVTALAYDDTTDLLHVGTSAGRSVFQGLRRVDNTTTAVETAISASNGLVVEE